MSTAAVEPSRELSRLEILRAFKARLGENRERNVSPFAKDRVICYHTGVQDCDVPAIHHEVRELIEETVKGIHEGLPSQVVILAGNPGMGKSHLLNHFRSAKRADELGYVFVGNSNHWKAEEFEECLLDWIIAALVRPSPDKPDLLLKKVQDLAFQALRQLLAQPGQIAQFKAKGPRGFFSRLWVRLTGHDHGRFQQMVEHRDDHVFRLLNLPRFADYVSSRFLSDSGNPFHRYVLHVLLRYLFPDDRELVLHWLRGKQVHKEFLKKLGALDAIDRHYKVVDAIKILISLFTPDVDHNLAPSGPANSRGRVFFFAFDQMEGRQELFEKDADWFKFFAQLSELYNALPNVFIVFTMTIHLRNKLYPQMEKQFQDRIKRDQRFLLHDIPENEILALYQQRVSNWLGSDPEGLREKLANPAFRFLPFTQQQVLEMSRFKTLREMLDEFDRQFRQALMAVTVKDPRYEFLVARNEFRQEEEGAKAFDYSANHLAKVRELFDQAGLPIARAAGLDFTSADWKYTEDKFPALKLEFKDPDNPSRWVRVFLVRLPYGYTKWLPGCAALLQFLQKKRYLLWLVRPEKIDPSLDALRPDQSFARPLAMSVHSSVRAMLHLLGKRAEYPPKVWAEAEVVLWEETKLTYLGEMLHQVREALDRQQDGEDGDQQPDAPLLVPEMGPSSATAAPECTGETAEQHSASPPASLQESQP
jgi:hypothetical protein